MQGDFLSVPLTYCQIIVHVGVFIKKLVIVTLHLDRATQGEMKKRFFKV